MIVSVERDDAIEAKLREVLAALGAQPVDVLEGVAGSVDLAAVTYLLSDGRIVAIERDNWIALAINGDPALLHEIEAQLGIELRPSR